jgi:predicted esterase
MEHAMSPSTYVRAGIAPVFQAHGDADPTVPYAASVELKKDLDKVGVKNAFDTVPGGGHGKWTAEENQRVDLDSLKFLKSVGVIP